ncbi:MAG: hypothetical protein L6R38_009082 [Xanthoria sp. 2 TBL-2021]|nr:MAG: hypothetical protein L6R38_009082 [Xanthoria sp. 2 TBL-2021]
MSSYNEPTRDARAHLLRSPLPTPYWGSQTGSAFTVRAVTTVEATPTAVLESLLDTSKYPAWNNFVPKVDLPSPSNGRLAADVLFTEHVDMFGQGKPSGLVKMKLLMTTLEEKDEHNGTKSFEVVWLGKAYPDWALRSERVHAISCDTQGTTTYDVWETFSGPLAVFVRLFVGSILVKRFKQWNEELRNHTEARTQT